MKHLKEMKTKSPFSKATGGGSGALSIASGKSPIKGEGQVKFNVDIKNEMRKMTILKNRLNGRMFHLSEKMTGIFQQNIALQNKLDVIYMKGSGNYDQKNIKPGPVNKSPIGEMKGTLNFPYKKREAIKIDQENIQMAKRIVKTNSTFNQSQLHNDYKQE